MLQPSVAASLKLPIQQFNPGSKASLAAERQGASLFPFAKEQLSHFFVSGNLGPAFGTDKRDDSFLSDHKTLWVVYRALPSPQNLKNDFEGERDEKRTQSRGGNEVSFEKLLRAQSSFFEGLKNDGESSL